MKDRKWTFWRKTLNVGGWNHTGNKGATAGFLPPATALPLTGTLNSRCL